MSFFESFRSAAEQSIEQGRERMENRQIYSRYQNVQQKENKYNRYSDNKLMEEEKYASGIEKEIIEQLLDRRGYVKEPDGRWDRRSDVRMI